MNHPPPLFRRLTVFSAVLTSAIFAAALTQRSQDASVASRWSPAYATLLLVLAALTAFAWISCLATVRRRLWGARKPLLLLGASLGFSLVVVEVVLRKLDPLGLAYYTEIARYIGLRQTDDVLVYVQPKDTQVTLDKVQVRFNNLGLRGQDIGQKQDQERRLLVLGDSVAFGWGVADELIFVTKLAEQLSATTGQSWTSINSGVCSYNTEQERLYLQHEGLALQPDLIVLVYVDNDIVSYPDLWKASAASKPPLRRRIKRAFMKSHLVQTLVHVMQRGGDGIELEGVERAVKASDPGWIRNMQALGELVGLCSEHSVPLAAYHFRWRSEPWSDALLAAAREAAKPIEITDTAAWFEGLDLHDLINSVTDSHPNAQAHALTAQQMYRDLEERKLFEVAGER